MLHKNLDIIVVVISRYIRFEDVEASAVYETDQLYSGNRG